MQHLWLAEEKSGALPYDKNLWLARAGKKKLTHFRTITESNQEILQFSPRREDKWTSLFQDITYVSHRQRIWYLRYVWVEEQETEVWVEISTYARKFLFFLISRVLLDEPFPQCRKWSYVDTKWLDHLTLFSQDRRLYLKKRNAAIVIACYVRGWKVGSISVMEVTSKETELSFPFSSRREVAI